MTKTLIIIPARMASTRLPDKPLADIEGVPMIVRVWRQAHDSAMGRVVVAADSDEICAAVQNCLDAVELAVRRTLQSAFFDNWPSFFMSHESVVLVDVLWLMGRLK